MSTKEDFMSTNQSKMYEANEAATGRLTVRDLVITGIFGALLLAAAAIGGVGFAITPTLTFYFPLGASLLPGPIFLLYLAKVPKRGGLTLIGIVVALLNLVTGMHWGNAIGAVVCAILAELIAGFGKYKSKKLNTIAYIVYSYAMMGSYVVYFIDPAGWAARMLGNGTSQDYIDQMNAAAGSSTLIIMIVGVAIVSVISASMGNLLLKKQFEKAGII